MATAFQRNAFQDSAFQIDDVALARPEVWWPLKQAKRRKHRIDDEYRARVYAEIAGELEEAIGLPKRAREIARVRRKAGKIAPAPSDAEQLKRFMAALQPNSLDAKRALEIARSLEYRARLNLLDEEDAELLLLLAD